MFFQLNASSGGKGRKACRVPARLPGEPKMERDMEKNRIKEFLNEGFTGKNEKLKDVSAWEPATEEDKKILAEILTDLLVEHLDIKVSKVHKLQVICWLTIALTEKQVPRLSIPYMQVLTLNFSMIATLIVNDFI